MQLKYFYQISTKNQIKAYQVTKLSTNKMMIASFSRALLQDLKNNQIDQEFNQALHEAIVKIYRASVD